MTTSGIPGLTLPTLSQFDPGMSGEGSLDPLGLAAISERLTEGIVPGFRARMGRFRFITATAVGAVAAGGATAAESEYSTTPSIAFEWLVVEAFVRDTSLSTQGVPGSQKAKATINRGDRLRPETYLKAPSVFGFSGIFKPLADNLSVLDKQLEPAEHCRSLVEAWEADNELRGFYDDNPSSDGGRFRRAIAAAVTESLQVGYCSAKPKSGVFKSVRDTLHPNGAGARERQVLRRLMTSGSEARTELSRHIEPLVGSGATEAEIVHQVLPQCSQHLRVLLEAIVAYETFAETLERAFRTLAHVSHARGPQPFTGQDLLENETIKTANGTLAAQFLRAGDAVADVDGQLAIHFADRFAAFRDSQPIPDLVGLLLSHHETIQAAKPPVGKRSWFEPVGDGFLVRQPYGSPMEHPITGQFIHPTRVRALLRFLGDTA